MSLPRKQMDLDKRTVHLTETKNGSSRVAPLTRQVTELFRVALGNPVRSLDTNLIFWEEPGRNGIYRSHEFRPASKVSSSMTCSLFWFLDWLRRV